VRLAVADAVTKAQDETDPLSGREREVLELLARGYTNRDIAQLLRISRRTVETHRGHVMHKLHLTTRAELVRYAREHGALVD
jgi:two-component system, NarL family, response regulator NreC